MCDEAAWLADYVKNGSEEAFRRLLERYLPLVYSAALRQVGGDAHLAQDVVQRVFVDFASKAGKISTAAPLAGWLHRHTCFIATSMLRGERRRKAREHHAIQMNSTESTSESKWNDPALMLDEAINQLGQKDRTAIVLRFLEQRDFNAVGRALGTTADAAQKRVTRALEKLRAIFGRHGIALSATALAASLGSQAVASVPAHLIHTVSAAALAGSAAAGGITALHLMNMTNFKMGMAGVILAAGIATPLVLQHQSNTRLRAEVESLRRQTPALEQLRDENESLRALKVDANELQQLRQEQAELLRLRAQAAEFRQREQELAQARAELQRLKTAGAGATSPATQAAAQTIPAEALKPASEWNNLGVATPDASFETWNWARARGDADSLAALLFLDPKAKAKADALFASLPESLRAKYGSAEGMMAVMQLNTKPIVAARVVSNEQLAPDRVLIRTQWQYANGELGENNQTLHFSDGGWRMATPAAFVDKLEKGLRLGGLTSAEATQQ